MARAWRIEYEGALYHILSRVNEKGDIFYVKADRVLFLDTIGQMSERFEIDIFAYVLMDNHYHLLIKTRRANLSKAMHWFGTTYTRRFNNRHNRSGHLFQGRYKSIIIENAAYLIQLSCYIHRNPVEGGLVKRLADYPWSSYLAYGYGKPAPNWLSTGLILSRFHGGSERRQYRDKVQKYSNEEKRLWEDFRHGLFLGSESFVKRLRKEYLPEKTDIEISSQRGATDNLRPDEAVDKAGRILGCHIDDFSKKQRVRGQLKEKRDLMIYFIWQTGSLTNEKIGSLFGITYSSVSHSVRSVRSKMTKDSKFRAYCDDLYSQFKV